jgi:hypothetical protein
MEDTQRSRTLKPARKVAVIEEIEHGLQRVPFMAENHLAGRANRFLLPPSDKCPDGFRGYPVLGGALQVYRHRPTQQVVESCDLRADQVMGDNAHTEGAAADLSRLPGVPVAEPSGVPQLASDANIVDLLIKKGGYIATGMLCHQAADGTARLLQRLDQRKIREGFLRSRFA